jgi:hypothetical protein
MARERRDWDGIVASVNEFMRILKRKPRYLKSCYRLNSGGILNAYRKGDLTFNQAVKELNRWKKAEKSKGPVILP